MSLPLSINSSQEEFATSGPTSFGTPIIIQGVGGSNGFTVMQVLLAAAAIFLVWKFLLKGKK